MVRGQAGLGRALEVRAAGHRGDFSIFPVLRIADFHKTSGVYQTEVYCFLCVSWSADPMGPGRAGHTAAGRRLYARHLFVCVKVTKRGTFYIHYFFLVFLYLFLPFSCFYIYTNFYLFAFTISHALSFA